MILPLRFLLLCSLCLYALGSVMAEPKQARVFIALCDNKTQGIVPVGEKIGNRDDPDANLYWGCSDGFGTYFRRSKSWKTTALEKDVSPDILRRMKLTHIGGQMELTAEAYRGSKIKDCLRDFENAAASGKYDLVAFIGHNGLMDFELAPPPKVEGNQTHVVVLCCLSEKYFGERLRALGCQPILMTRQLMYPGSFLLHAAIDKHLAGADADAIRTAATAAYAANQKISTRAALGVFSGGKE
ncbi:MAG: hypothetical protein ACKO2G_02705 [Verrucomicrobiales bacterium]